MTTKQLVKLVSTAAILLILALSVGLTSAHETDNPHTHDTVSDGGRAVAFLVIPISGEQFPFHWLWHFMSGETSGDHRLLKHDVDALAWHRALARLWLKRRREQLASLAPAVISIDHPRPSKATARRRGGSAANACPLFFSAKEPICHWRSCAHQASIASNISAIVHAPGSMWPLARSPRYFARPCPATNSRVDSAPALAAAAAAFHAAA